MCVVCAKGGRLHAHHLDAYATHPGARRTLSNGVCLCESCHRMFHKARGLRVQRADFYDAYGFPNPDEGIDWDTIALPAPSGNRADAIEMMRRASAGLKGDALEDLRKARWYIDREIQRLEKRRQAVDGVKP